jgi:hypothetical protein
MALPKTAEPESWAVESAWYASRWKATVLQADNLKYFPRPVKPEDSKHCMDTSESNWVIIRTDRQGNTQRVKDKFWRQWLEEGI